VTVRASVSLLAVISLLLAGCGNGPRLGETSEPMMVTQLTELPPPQGSADGIGELVYRFAPLDELAVIVANAPELTGTFKTDTRGRFLLPYIGEVEAAGRTPGELAADIDRRLRGTIINDPHVAVNIEEARSLAFTVDGQVTEPGSYPIDGNMSLMRAVAAAKGVSEFARLDDVVVFRDVKGEKMAALYNLGAIRRGLYADPRIYADDVVVVGDSPARRRFQQIVQALPLITTPIVLALQARR